MISFDNTENAFKAKTDAELKRSYLLFKLIGSPVLVKFGAATAPLALQMGFKGLIKSTIFKQFVGGENIHDCSETIAQLGKYRIGTILDYSVEGKETEPDFEHCVEETLATINKAKNESNIPFCVFKVTGLARFDLLTKVSSGHVLSKEEDAEWNRVKSRVELICRTAANSNQPIFIDAEESWIQVAIDRLAEENMAAFNRDRVIVYNTYQMYRHDRLAYLKESFDRARQQGYNIGAKLVRGAYMEKERRRAVEMNYPSPIQQNKKTTDHDYDEALRFCVEHINHISICAGTHNEASSLLLVNLMRDKNIQADDKRIYFSQLLGMSDHISYNLSLNGYNVVKYVPYGPVKDVLPYLIRRAQENTSVKGQTGRELSLIIREQKRRSSMPR